MTTWILILTIWGRGHTNSSMSIVAVPGFQTEAACTSAANTWLDSGRVNYTYPKTAICAQTR